MLSYIYGPTIVYDGEGKPIAIKGSISDDLSEFTMVISIKIEDALGRFTVVEKEEVQPDNARVGSRALTEEELEGTDLSGEEYRFRSLNSVYLLSMKLPKIVGSILDDEVQNEIGCKWGGARALTGPCRPRTPSSRGLSSTRFGRLSRTRRGKSCRKTLPPRCTHLRLLSSMPLFAT